MGWQDAPVVDKKTGGWQDAPVVGASETKPQSTKQEPSRLLTTASNVARGLLTGGPLGMATAGVGEGLRGLDEASDIAGGAVTDAMASVSGKRSVLNPFAVEVPAEVSGALGAATKVGIPAVVGGLGGGAAGKPAAEAGARKLMQQALRPGSKPLANDKAAQAIDTMLREGVSATTGGAVKLRHLITKLKAEVAKEIASRPGSLVDKAHVYKELQATLDDVSKLGRPDAPREAVLKAWEAFKNHPLAAGENTKIPLALADEMKRTTQRAAKDAYGRLTATPIDDKIDMAIATGLRKGVEAEAPTVGPINAKLSEYINALNLIEPRAAQEANKQIGGLVPLAPTAEQAMLMLADRNPWMKSAIARALYQGRRAIPAGTGATAAAATTGQ